MTCETWVARPLQWNRLWCALTLIDIEERGESCPLRETAARDTRHRGLRIRRKRVRSQNRGGSAENARSAFGWFWFYEMYRFFVFDVTSVNSTASGVKKWSVNVLSLTTNTIILFYQRPTVSFSRHVVDVLAS